MKAHVKQSIPLIAGAILAVVALVICVPRPNYLISVLLMIGALGAAVVSFSMWRDWFSPFSVMGTTWLLSLSISNLQLTNYFQEPWTLTTWFVLLASLGAFWCGCAPALLYAGRWPRMRSTSWFATWCPRRIKRVIYGCLMTGGIGFAYQAMVAGNVPVLAHDPGLAKDTFQLPFIGYAFVLLVPASLLAYVYVELWGLRRNKAVAVSGILAFLLLLAALARVHPFFVLLVVFFARNMIRPWRLTWRKVFLIISFGLALLLLFSLIGDIRGNTLEGASAEELVQQGRVDLPPVLVFPYLYVASNFNNLQTTLQRNEELTLGLRTFLPVLGVLQLDQGLDLPTYRFGSGSLVASTYLVDWYQDFGMLGVLAIPFCLGLLSTWVYLKARTTGQLVYVLLWGIVGACITLTVFSNFFSKTYVWYYVCLLMATHIYSRKRVPRRAPNRVDDGGLVRDGSS